MKMLVTGGTGFLGRHCAVRLKSLNHDVTVLGRNIAIGAELEKRGIRFIHANLEDASAVHSAIIGQESVVHAGAFNSRWGQYREFYNANVLGTKHVIDACLAHRVRRLVHLSTPSLYFNNKDRCGILESEPIPTPRSNYTATKLMADYLIDNATAQGLSCITLRPRAIIGPGDRNVLGRILKGVRNETLYLPNGGKALVDLTYIDNAVDAVLLALNTSKDVSGKKFNITNGEPMTFHKMVELVSRGLNLHLAIRAVPFSVAYLIASVMELGYGKIARQQPPFTREMIRFMAQSHTLDISAAREVLGYVPTVSLSDGIDSFASWWVKCESPKTSFAESIGLDNRLKK